MTLLRRSVRRVAAWLLSTESERNPKVMLGRFVSAVLPDRALYTVKKAYYLRLVKQSSDDWLVERDFRVAKELIAQGDYVVDVGAAIGCFTKALSQCVGPLGRVYSFEPVPPVFDFLTHNVRKLGLKNVEVINYAISKTEGSAVMVIPKYRWGSECWYDARFSMEPGDSSLRQLSVSTTTIDSYFSNGNTRISFIKCDANYHELACLLGALRTLRTSKPALLVEILTDPDDPATAAFETFALLRSEAYHGYWFDGQALRPWRPGDRSQNYFFLNEAHINALREKANVPLHPGTNPRG